MTYSIKVTPQYFQGTLGAPQERYLTWRDLADNPNDAGPYPDDIAEWETKEEAQAIIDDWESGIYYLQHGEAGRPDYAIVEDLEDDLDDCQNAEGAELSGYIEIERDDLPPGVGHKLDRLNVEFYENGDDYDIYAAFLDHDGVKYRIAFCPRTIALQKYADDLGCLDWTNPAYYKQEG
jgi:hypothetical protein